MRLLTLVMLCFVLQNCRQAEVYDKNITYIRTEDLKEVEDFNPLNLIDSSTYIRLETSEKVLIGAVDEIKVTKDRVYVSDLTNNDLSVFDRQGKFLHKIGSKGRGPQEYHWLAAFCLTPTEDTVIIYDGGNLRLQFYTTDNRYVRSVNLYHHLHRDSNVFRRVNKIHALPNGQLLVNYNYMYLCPVHYSLYDYDRDTLRDIGYTPFVVSMPRPTEAFTIGDPIITQYGGVTSCGIEFNDTIFQLSGQALRPRFVVPAMKDRVVSDKLIQTQNGKEDIEAIRLLSNSGMFITAVNETEHYFFITYWDREIAREIIWNKHQGKGIVVTSYDYYAYRYEKPHKLTMSEVFDEEDDSPLLHTPELDRLRPELNEDDNPLIVIYHLKNVEF